MNWLHIRLRFCTFDDANDSMFTTIDFIQNVLYDIYVYYFAMFTLLVATQLLR